VEANRIGPNGMLRFLNDLNIGPESRTALVLAWKLDAQTQCEFSQKEFREGMAALKLVNQYLNLHKFSIKSGQH
jgi:DCN1-like protein 1/2